MQKYLLRIAFLLLFFTALNPIYAQENEENTTPNPTETQDLNSQDNNPNNTQNSPENSEKTSETDTTETKSTETDTLNDADEKQEETQEQSLPEQLQQQNDKQQARKNAIRELSQKFPAPQDQTTANAEPAPSTLKEISTITHPPAKRVSELLPHFELHGYLRNRLQYFGNYDLDTRGTSPVAVPLDSKHRSSEQQPHIKLSDKDAHLWSDMRFRFQPSLHITESSKIVALVDIMDNFVLGTNPDKLKYNPHSSNLFSFNGTSNVSVGKFTENVIKIKALYAEVDTLLGNFRLGRIPTHWGLGMVYNDGGTYNRSTQIIDKKAWSCLFCDATDFTDKIAYRVRDPFFNFMYLEFSWDFVDSGLASYNPNGDTAVQAYDMAESDDALQFNISLFNKPLSQQELDERYRDLFAKRILTFDWGLLFSYREQSNAPVQDAQIINNGSSAQQQLYAQKAEMYALDLWLRTDLPLPHDLLLRLELEALTLFGKIKRDQAEEPKSQDLLHIGLAFESEIKWKDLSAGLKTGFAWSDNLKYSGHPLIDNANNIPRGSLFRFDSSYQIDQIMFKELMGGVNNAYYFNIFAEYRFPIEMADQVSALGIRGDLSTSLAINKNATPGKSRWYGAEADLRLFYNEVDRFHFEFISAIFLPGEAWTRRESSLYPVLPSPSVYENDLNITKDYKPSLAWFIGTNFALSF